MLFYKDKERRFVWMNKAFLDFAVMKRWQAFSAGRMKSSRCISMNAPSAKWKKKS